MPEAKRKDKMVLGMLLGFLVLTGLVLAQEKGDWVFKTCNFGTTSPDMQASLEYEEEHGTYVIVDSTQSSRGVWRLYQILDHPSPGEDWEVSMKVKVIAPGIDLDGGKTFSSGEEEDNDGPNFFGFIYSYANASHQEPGFTDSMSVGAYPSESALCHVHFECNWVGDPEEAYGFYCSSKTITQGWVADGPSIGSYTNLNDADSEAFSDEWKEITFEIDENECLSDQLNLVLMGADTIDDKTYTWKIREVTIEAGGEETPLSLDSVYDWQEEKTLVPPPYCGDGKIDEEEGEECDGNASSPGYECTENCTLESVCGDGFVTPDEECDENNCSTSPCDQLGYECINCSQLEPVCGDGILTSEEFCDPALPENHTNYTEGFKCQDTGPNKCQEMTTECGDGIAVGQEECDGIDSTPAGYGCTDNCTTYRLLSTDEKAIVKKLFSLMEQSKVGEPAESEYAFVGGGAFTIGELEDQVKVLNITSIPSNSEFHFCTEQSETCEKDFLLEHENVYASNQTFKFNQSHGWVKVSKKEEANQTKYFIGYKPEKALIPLLGNWGIVVIIIAALVIIGGLVGTLGFLVFYYLKKVRVKKRKK